MNVFAPGKHNGDDAVFRFTNREPALLFAAVRTPNEAYAIKDFDCFVEVDAMLAAIDRRFVFIPFDRANALEQFSNHEIIFFRYSDPPPNGGYDTYCTAEGSL